MPPINCSYDNENKMWCYKKSSNSMIRVFMGTDYFVMTDYVIGPYLEISSKDELAYVKDNVKDYMRIAGNTIYYINLKYKNLDVLNVVNIDRTLKLNTLSEISTIPISTSNNPTVTNILINPMSQSDVSNSRKTIYRQNNKSTVLGSFNSGVSYNHIRQGIDSTSRVMSGNCSELNETVDDIYTFSKKFKNISSNRELEELNSYMGSATMPLIAAYPAPEIVKPRTLKENEKIAKLSDMEQEEKDNQLLKDIENK